jgi:alpha-L-fucosidase 2
MDEVMQLDAGFGALTAVFELLVQNRRGEIWVLPNLQRPVARSRVRRCRG